MSAFLSPLSEEGVLAQLHRLCTLLQQNPPKPEQLGLSHSTGPYALYYHQVEVMTRARDIGLITRRLFRNRAQREQAERSFHDLRPFDIPAGLPWPSRVAKASLAVDEIVHELKV